MKVFKYILAFSALLFFGKISSAQVKDRLPCVDKEFSMVVHVIKDSVGDLGIDTLDILTYVDTLNRYFSPICVSFTVCEFNLIDDWRYNDFDVDSMWTEMQVKYHRENRINIFYVNSVTNPPNECSYSDSAYITRVDSGGVVLDKTGSCYFDPFKVLVHEMGHYFGLPNTFVGGELVDGSNCTTAGDEFCDTPADPYNLGDDIPDYIDGNCRFINGATDANSDYYTPHVGNAMSYYPGACMCEFSYEQLLFMARVYLSGTGMW